MWFLWLALTFLLIWAIWAGAWTVIFVAWDHLPYTIFFGMALVVFIGLFKQAKGRR